MTTEEQELRELDQFTAEHVMGWRRGFDADGQEVWYGEPGVCRMCTEWEPTIEPADALAVLEKCRERVRNQSHSEAQYSVRIDCEYSFTVYRLESKFMECRPIAEANTLPLAICQFAKKLFEK